MNLKECKKRIKELEDEVKFLRSQLAAQKPVFIPVPTPEPARPYYPPMVPVPPSIPQNPTWPNYPYIGDPIPSVPYTTTTGGLGNLQSGQNQMRNQVVPSEMPVN